LLELQHKILKVICAYPRGAEAITAVHNAAMECNEFTTVAILYGVCPKGHPAEYAETDGSRKYYIMGCNHPGCRHHGRWSYSIETMPEDIDTGGAIRMQFAAWNRG